MSAKEIETRAPLNRAAHRALRRMASAEGRSLENAAARAVTEYLRAHGYFEVKRGDDDTSPGAT